MAAPISSQPLLHLASQSPRRRELLRQIGVPFTSIAVGIDETPLATESPETFVARLASDKARAGWRSVNDERPVLGADTAVVLGDRILGKPRDRLDGLEMLAALSAATHRVLTGVALVRGEHESVRVSDTRVTFRPLSRGECEAYWRSGEPRDKAGGYAIQGLAAVFVSRIEGSYTGVVGLPLFETCELLGEFGIYVLE